MPKSIFMKRIHITSQNRPPLLLLILLAALTILVLVACTSNRLKSNIGTSPQPTQQPTTVQGYGATYGCPSDVVVTSLSAPNVRIKPTDENSTVTAHVGEVVEVQLPFGHRWTGPNISGDGLQLLSPSGFASTADKMCVWRFNALSKGLTQLAFSAQAICKKGQVCPLYVFAVTFRVEVK